MITTLTETDSRVCEDSRHEDIDMKLLGCDGPARVEQAVYAVQTKRGDRYSVCARCAWRIARTEREFNTEYLVPWQEAE